MDRTGSGNHDGLGVQAVLQAAHVIPRITPSIVMITSMLAVSAPAGAQRLPVANPASTTLPGDRLPPAGPLPPPPPPGHAHPEPGSDAPSPGMAAALMVAQGALDACGRAGHKVGVAVVDMAGQPRVGLSADGASGGHIYMAVRKSLAVLAFDAPSSQVAARLAADPGARAKLRPGTAPMAGAVPLRVGGRLVGALGVSGASSLQDEACAREGAAHLPPS